MFLNMFLFIFPYKTMISFQITLDASTSRVSEVPKGMEPHVVDIVKEDKVALGISLVPAVGTCIGLFQVCEWGVVKC